jgi:hypothetical protein
MFCEGAARRPDFLADFEDAHHRRPCAIVGANCEPLRPSRTSLKPLQMKGLDRSFKSGLSAKDISLRMAKRFRLRFTTHNFLCASTSGIQKVSINGDLLYERGRLGS